MAIVYAFIGFPVIGVGCGAVVAHWTHSTAALSVGGFIGIVVGCLCAVVLVKWSDRRS